MLSVVMVVNHLIFCGSERHCPDGQCLEATANIKNAEAGLEAWQGLRFSLLQLVVCNIDPLSSGQRVIDSSLLCQLSSFLNGHSHLIVNIAASHFSLPEF